MIEEISLLHLNDLHSHFEAFPKIERFFSQFSQSQSEVIKVDLGDNIDRSHPLSDVTKGQANILLMNQLGIDYATIGNNEGIGLRKEDLNQVYKEADFKLVIGNFYDQGACPSWAKPYDIYMTKEGTKIAFLAYTFPYYKTYIPNGWQIDDPIEVLKRDMQIPQVAQADVKILLSHLGIRLDEKITEEIDGLDLIIGSHTHHVFEEGASLNGTYLAAAGKYGHYVGEITIRLEDHKLKEMKIIAHETSHMPSKAYDQTFVDNLILEGQKKLSQHQIVTLDQSLNQEESLELLMDAMKDYASADLSIINSGLLVQPFGKIVDARQLQSSLPHQMRLARLEVTQAELEEICQDIFSQASLLEKQEIRGMGFRGKRFGRICSSGFTYKNEKIVYNNKVMGKSEKVSLVLVDQYYFASYFPSIKNKKVTLLFPDLLRELVEDYILKTLK
ncbi:bifunctional metallophosphatase/5'-nucleotidase [Streptococcus catagoni]|uniref:bifunctional metallophosphatase/5'-nucleotidase n=1 Tax=Streptococcus catagoni TaxID=2654874 RepID=UPI00140A590A|nr:metallophosphatase [Streptococcus catagoni]